MAVLDTLTFLMDQVETQYILTSKNTLQDWGKVYAKYYKDLIHKIKSGTKDYVVMAHISNIYNETDMVVESKVPIKGSVGRTGCEADFSIVLSSKRLTINEAEQWEKDNPLLTITEDDRELGVKYVFQTRIDANTLGEPIRSPMGLFTKKEKYIDNNLSKVFERLHDYNT